MKRIKKSMQNIKQTNRFAAEGEQMVLEISKIFCLIMAVVMVVICVIKKQKPSMIYWIFVVLYWTANAFAKYLPIT